MPAEGRDGGGVEPGEEGGRRTGDGVHRAHGARLGREGESRGLGGVEGEAGLAGGVRGPHRGETHAGLDEVDVDVGARGGGEVLPGEGRGEAKEG